MIMKTIKVEDKKITLFYNEMIDNKRLPMIILNTYEEDGEEIWKESLKLTDKNFILVTISNINWNQDLSPWYMDKLFKGEEDYSGKADNYLKLLVERIVPEVTKIVMEEFKKEISYYCLAGYSLAGLFAIYSLYKTNVFQRVISASGSLWYPNFSSFIKDYELLNKPDKIYFSLGNKEKNTKNELMKEVEDKTKYLEKYYHNQGIETIYEENEGGHFQDVNIRIAKGISWILK